MVYTGLKIKKNHKECKLLLKPIKKVNLVFSLLKICDYKKKVIRKGKIFCLSFT